MKKQSVQTFLRDGVTVDEVMMEVNRLSFNVDVTKSLIKELVKNYLDHDKSVDEITWMDETGEVHCFLSALVHRASEAIVKKQDPKVLETITELVRECIKVHQMKVEYQYDTLFRSPYHIAASLGVSPLIECFIALGVDPNVKDRAGKIPLHHALSGKWDDLSADLLIGVSDLTLHSNRGGPALHVATKYRRIDAVKTICTQLKITEPEYFKHLLSQRDAEGFSVLDCAVKNARIDLIQVIISQVDQIDFQTTHYLNAKKFLKNYALCHSDQRQEVIQYLSDLELAAQEKKQLQSVVAQVRETQSGSDSNESIPAKRLIL